MSSKEITIEDLSGMSVTEQIHLAQEILSRVASIVEQPEGILNAEQRAEMNRRIEELDKNPNSAVSREQVRAELNAL